MKVMNSRRFTAVSPVLSINRIAHLSYGRRALRCSNSVLCRRLGQTTMFAMSGLAPIAAVMPQCHDRSKSAITGREQSQQTRFLFDHLVGEREHLVWNLEAERL